MRRRQSLGVSPVNFLNAAANAVREGQPSAAAIDTIDSSASRSMFICCGDVARFDGPGILRLAVETPKVFGH